MRRLFITATDTGVGKTLTTSALVVALRRRGHRVWALKPVASGGVPSDDTLALCRVTGATPESVTGWSFHEPAAPPVAARVAGSELSLDAIVAWIRRQQEREPDAIWLVEGVGGLLCPLTETATIADLACRLGDPVLIVARRGLGTINHTLLTVEVALQRGLNLVGVLMTETQPTTTLAERTAPEELQQRLAIPLLGVLPYTDPPDPERLADDLAQMNVLDWFEAPATF